MYLVCEWLFLLSLLKCFECTGWFTSQGFIPKWILSALEGNVNTLHACFGWSNHVNNLTFAMILGPVGFPPVLYQT